MSVHFGEGKTKSILFSPKHRSNSIGQIDISYKNVKIKQDSKVTYLGCVLDECQAGESMAMQVCTKITSKLKFFYCKVSSPFLYIKNKFLSKDLRRLLRNALIQPHFDYACAAWCTNCRFYKTRVYVSAYNCSTGSTSELNILTRVTGFQ